LHACPLAKSQNLINKKKSLAEGGSENSRYLAIKHKIQNFIIAIDC